MMYNNPIYGIFNQEYIQEQFIRNQHHDEQVRKSFECAKKLNDFMESMGEVEPEYQQLALEQCCLVFVEYMKRHGIV